MSIYTQTKRALQDVQETQILSELTDEAILAGTTEYLPATGFATIEDYDGKTITLLADFALTYIIQVSDDGVDFNDYYAGTLVADTLDTRSFTEKYLYVRVEITNPDIADHVITEARIKGQV